MSDEDWVDLLREAHRESIDPAHYAAVRARVLGQLRRRRHPFWRRAWAWGLAAAAVAIAILMLPRPVGRTSRPAFLVYGPSAPMAEAPIPVPARRGHRVLAKAKQEGRPGGQPHLDGVTIKLMTDDPNVIIYWIADAEGE